MNNLDLYVYSEQDVTPKAVDVIRGIVKDAYPDHIFDIYTYDANLGVDKVLVFGNKLPDNRLKNVKFVHTYSVAQIMTKANAATVLKAAVRQFITEPEPIPFIGCMAVHRPLSLYEIVMPDHSDPIAIDIETTGNLGETHTPEEVEILSVAFYSPRWKRPYVVVPMNQGAALGEEQLADLAVLLPRFQYAIYHNGKFDIRVLNRVLGIELKNSFDTMLAHHVLNMAAGDHKLKRLAMLYYGAEDWEGDIKQYLTKGGHYENIPTARLAEYNGMDVYWTYKLWELFNPQIEADEENQKAMMLEMAFADFLLDVEEVGIPFDRKHADVLGGALATEADMSKQIMRKMVMDADFNPGSHVQIKLALSHIYGVATPSTDEAHINQLKIDYPNKRVLNEFLDELLKYRKAMKQLGTYVKGWSKHERNGRVHPTFLVHGTSTGRLSSTGPNAQNVPRDKTIRRLVAITEDSTGPAGPTVREG